MWRSVWFWQKASVFLFKIVTHHFRQNSTVLAFEIAFFPFLVSFEWLLTSSRKLKIWFRSVILIIDIFDLYKFFWTFHFLENFLKNPSWPVYCARMIEIYHHDLEVKYQQPRLKILKFWKMVGMVIWFSKPLYLVNWHFPPISNPRRLEELGEFWATFLSKKQYVHSRN